MRYRLYLYKTAAQSATAPAVRMANEALYAQSEAEWNFNRIEKTMLPFDAEAIKGILLKKTEATPRPLCRGTVRLTPERSIPYVEIQTSYELIRQVLPKLTAIAAEYSLILYDRQTGKTFFASDFCDDGHIDMKLRAKTLNEAIQSRMKPIFRLRKLPLESPRNCAYCITLRKDPETSFDRRTEQFYQILTQRLQEGETLVNANHAFIIDGNRYTITYCLEAYQKSADRIGFIIGGQARTSLIRRIGTEPAAKRFQNLPEQAQEAVIALMEFADWIKKYPNPADRFSAAVKNSARQKEDRLFYRGIGDFGTGLQISLYREAQHGLEIRECSRVGIPAQYEPLIRPILEPYFPDSRLWDIETRIQPEWMLDAAEKAKKIREFLIRGEERRIQEEIPEVFDRTDPNPFLQEKRTDVIRLYGEFLSWIDDLANYLAVAKTYFSVTPHW